MIKNNEKSALDQAQARIAELEVANAELQADRTEEDRVFMLAQEQKRKLKAQVAELERELKILKDPSDGRCMEISALRERSRKNQERIRELEAKCADYEKALKRYQNTRQEVVSTSNEVIDYENPKDSCTCGYCKWCQ